MRIHKSTFLSVITVLIASLLLVSCSSKSIKDQDPEDEISEDVQDYQKIIESGKLVVLAENSSTSYFVYRGEDLGFEYEILKAFSKEIGLELEVKIVGNLDNLVPMLNNHEGDIIAANYTITRDRNKEVNFSLPYLQTPQVLVQRKPEGWKKMKSAEVESHLVKDAIDLAKKHVSIWDKSSYFQRINHLQDEIGDTIFVEPISGLIGSEELIERVSQGIIDYTITEENIAKVNARFYDNIDIQTIVSVKQNMAFGLRHQSSLLKAKLDKWLETFLKSKTFKHIYHKYYEVGVAGSDQINTTTPSYGRGKISPYDEFFKASGKKHNVDWRLVAAVAFTESRFKADIEGFGGSYGMMQFMPNTGPKYDVYPGSPPDVQINGGSKKIANDIKKWSHIPDPVQRVKFALASYNAGLGHIEDARRLAVKHGLNGDIWDDNVEIMLLNLSKQEYYRDEVVKFGSLRGTTTFNYVKKVTERYEMYKAGS